VRQLVDRGPFVVQLREDMGMGSARLTRHPAARKTTFRVLGYMERSEIGLPCFVIRLEDERDGRAYVVDTGLMGPGLPADAFAIEDDAPG
jgi:hypothetical protein